MIEMGETTGRFTEQLGGLLWDKLDQQTDARLREIIAECESLTATNCGWVAYGLRDIVARVAKDRLLF